MNEKANKLGMDNTTTTVGRDWIMMASIQVRDVSKLLKIALGNEVLGRYLHRLIMYHLKQILIKRDIYKKYGI